MLDLFARVLLAVVFLVAFAGKVRSRRGFAEFRDSIAALVSLPALPLAVAVLAGEALAVVLLAVPGTRLGYGVAVTLLAAFCGVIALAITGRKAVRCRCFGAGGDVLGPKHLVRNGLLIAVAALGAFVPAPVSWEEPLTLLTIAVVLLAVVVALHVLFTYGLVARVRELQENAQPKRESNLPPPGLVIKPFSVVDTSGVPFTETDLDGPAQVGFFSVGCGPCRTLTDALLADPPAARLVHARRSGDGVRGQVRGLRRGSGAGGMIRNALAALALPFKAAPVLVGGVAIALLYFCGHLGEVVRQRVAMTVESRLFQRVATLPGLARIEDPAFHDRLRLAEQAAQEAPGTISQFTQEVVRSVVLLAGFTGVLLVV